MACKAVAVHALVQQITEVSEVLLGHGVINPLAVNDLFLSERHVDRVGDPVVQAEFSNFLVVIQLIELHPCIRLNN